MTTAFDEVEFPTAIAQGAQGGPKFQTRIVTTGAGYEFRNQDWPEARGEWNVGTGIKKRADFDAVIAFFRARRGRARGFRFKDWSDFRDSDGGAVGQIKTNSGGQLQLAKIYTDDGGITYTRFIAKPIVGTLTLPASCSVDGTTGICTGAGAVDGAAWTGEFRVPVRFDTDHLNTTVHIYEVEEWPDIPIVELRL